LTADLPDYGGSLMAPFGSFFIYMILGGILIFVTIWIIGLREKAYRNQSKQEIEINRNTNDLEEYTKNFKGLINTLSDIEVFLFNASYIPFKIYFKG
jgi:NhaP-type Na+/H+ or K+/H+ antiporter